MQLGHFVSLTCRRSTSVETRRNFGHGFGSSKERPFRALAFSGVVKLAPSVGAGSSER